MKEFTKQDMINFVKWYDNKNEDKCHRTFEKELEEWLANRLEALVRQGDVQPVFACGNCEDCKYWLQQSSLGDKNFGACNNPKTFSWVSGRLFEPPKNFGCINFESKQTA